MYNQIISQIGYSRIGLWLYVNRFQIVLVLAGIALILLGMKAIFITGSESLASALDFYFLPALSALGIVFGKRVNAYLNRRIDRKEKRVQ